ARSIVLDVKWGSGAFMRTVEEARTLARDLVRIGEGAGRATRAVLSSMREPLGRTVGNALEIREAIDTLNGTGPDDLWALTLELGSHLLRMSGLAESEDAARAKLTELRDSGAGARKLAELIEAQHGDPRVVDDTSILPVAPVVATMQPSLDEAAWIVEADARAIGEAALALGAGRRKKGDPVDPAVGIVMLARIGDRVEPGQPVAEVHARTQADADRAAAALAQAIRFSQEPVDGTGLGYEVIGE
ncbi:MAG TPA: hypothetical protein VFR81_10525, partial [Longimicrobium sp.]|nr:hypothetical protein [Longimicrobium sp.]